MHSTKKQRNLAAMSIVTIALVGLFVLAYAQGVFAGSPDITEEEAKAIAEEETGGTAVGIAMEKEGFKVLYEVNVDTPDGPAEVEIDAKTGEVVEVEWGPDDD